MKRITSIDILRGVVMIIMALDHTRDLLHVSSITETPTNLATTTTALFFTRWITHFCAPTFVFLSGVSAYLSFKRKNNPRESQRFLLTRGLWLIVVEFTVVNFGVWFDPHFGVFLFDVIATIGCGFIVLSLLVRAPVKALAIIGLLIIFLQGLVPLIPFADNSLFKQVLLLFFAPGAVPLGGGRLFVMAYPPIPWTGIMLVGFAAGSWFERTEAEQRKLFLRVGLSALTLFIAVRALNIYGDTFPWAKQSTSWFTILSFLNVTKYPPSLSFCLLTLGGMFLLLFALNGWKSRLAAIPITYGKVPLFYFVIHWYIIHPLLFFIVWLQGYRAADFVFGFNFGRPKGPSGVTLLAVYGIWIGVVILLYPLCKAYGRFKESHPQKKWLRYF